jgi:hypothetical protein
MTGLTTLFFVFLFFAAPVPTTLAQIKAEPNPERRAREAVDFALTAEKSAETAYAKGDLDATADQLKVMMTSLALAQSSFQASGKTPGRNPGPYKYAEQRSQELLIRLRDLEQRMDSDERETLTASKTKAQEIHDEWFEGIMGRKK